jgi:hypothetical protein
MFDWQQSAIDQGWEKQSGTPTHYHKGKLSVSAEIGETAIVIRCVDRSSTWLRYQRNLMTGNRRWDWRTDSNAPLVKLQDPIEASTQILLLSLQMQAEMEKLLDA